MASRDALIERRIRAMHEIKSCLPGVSFGPAQNAEMKHVKDLEAVAVALRTLKAKQENDHGRASIEE